MTSPEDGHHRQVSPPDGDVSKRPSQNAVVQAMRRFSLTVPTHSTHSNGHMQSSESFVSEDGEKLDGVSDMETERDCKKGVFIDAEAMKEKVRANLAMDRADTTAHFKETGAAAYLAKNVWFERIMLAVIALNSMWIAVDTDHNSAEVLIMASPVFIVAENFFCLAFSAEWIIRFFSFQKKKYMLKDAWFCFDTVMVVMMVLETWVLSLYILLSSSTGGGSMLGGLPVLKMARLLRLSRMTRMARLLRAMPELMIMVKGMITAVRSVAITLTLLILIMYVFGIAFCQMTKGTDVGRRHYPHVVASMYTLGIYGTLTDNIKYMSDELGKETFLLSVLFFLYVLLTAFTVMNMLIGVLCEVVSAVAATEREEILVAYVRSKLLKVVEEIDQDGDRHITKAEMVGILENASACRALKEVGVDVMSLVDNADAIFMDVKGREMHHLSFADFMNVVLSLRGSNNATVKDIVELRKSLRLMNEDIVSKFQQPMMKLMHKVLEAHHHGKHASHHMVDSRSNTVTSLPVRSPLAEEHLDLTGGNWCPCEKPVDIPIPNCSKLQQLAGLVPQRKIISPPEKPAPILCSVVTDAREENASSSLQRELHSEGWCGLPQAVPEEPPWIGIPDRPLPVGVQIPERPPRPPVKLLAPHARPQPMEDNLWHGTAPLPTGIPVPELPHPSLWVVERPAEPPDALVPKAPAWQGGAGPEAWSSPGLPAWTIQSRLLKEVGGDERQRLPVE